MWWFCVYFENLPFDDSWFHKIFIGNIYKYFPFSNVRKIQCLWETKIYLKTFISFRFIYHTLSSTSIARNMNLFIFNPLNIIKGNRNDFRKWFYCFIEAPALLYSFLVWFVAFIFEIINFCVTCEIIGFNLDINQFEHIYPIWLRKKVFNSCL